MIQLSFSLKEVPPMESISRISSVALLSALKLFFQRCTNSIAGFNRRAVASSRACHTTLLAPVFCLAGSRLFIFQFSSQMISFSRTTRKRARKSTKPTCELFENSWARLEDWNSLTSPLRTNLNIRKCSFLESKRT